MLATRYKKAIWQHLYKTLYIVRDYNLLFSYNELYPFLNLNIFA